MRKLQIAALAFAPLCALAACSQSEDGTTIDRKGHRPDASVAQPDASVAQPDARALDAAAVDGGASSAGSVSCYTEGDPAQSCALPVHCCFSNYSSAHDGFCTSAACAYGTIDCDGPEDCGGGERCCSHALFASDGSLAGYAIGCQAGECGAAPASYELCHVGGAACSNGGSCVSAFGNDNDLPRTLSICQ